MKAMGNARRRHIVRTLAILLLVGAVPLNAIFAWQWMATTLPAEAVDMAVSDHDHAGHDHVNPAAGTTISWADQDTKVPLAGGQQRAEWASQDLFRPEPPLPRPLPPPRYL